MLKKLGWSLLFLSTLSFLFIFAIPFLTLSTAQKTWTIAALAIFSEIAFWVSGLLLGKAYLSKIRKWLNPLQWFRRS